MFPRLQHFAEAIRTQMFRKQIGVAAGCGRRCEIVGCGVAIHPIDAVIPASEELQLPVRDLRGLAKLRLPGGGTAIGGDQT